MKRQRNADEKVKVREDILNRELKADDYVGFSHLRAQPQEEAEGPVNRGYSWQ